METTGNACCYAAEYAKKAEYGRRAGRNGPRALWLVLPIVCYNPGAMPLLCGDDYRFFHYTRLAVWPVALMLLNGDGEPNGETRMSDGQRETKEKSVEKGRRCRKRGGAGFFWGSLLQ